MRSPCRALVATGSPFAPVVRDGRTIRISQCNNVYIFPGVGQGVLTSGARRVPDTFFLAAARALADASPATRDPDLGLLPPLDDVVPVSRRIALGVIADAQRLGLAPTLDSEEWTRRLDARWWEPEYAVFRKRC
ncbi:MAG TPA: malic enzyme-like NAD(P)-binding protein [Isosphaeraceae bacterium]|nr:malic enzyme-like NAD(P)-binding protein [Isosphaeraceae bacterium]